jgi:hypothetical protein
LAQGRCGACNHDKLWRDAFIACSGSWQVSGGVVF